MNFLTPSPAVVARSPMERLALAAGGRIEEREGWGVAVFDSSFPGTVGFADRSWLAKFEVHGELGIELGVARRVDDAWWCPVTPVRTLVVGAAPGREAVDLTCALCAIELLGPLARETLARFCAIDLRDAVAPVGAFRPGSIARTPGYLLRSGADRLLLMVGWAYGEYLWEVVADAAGHLGGGPVA